MSQTPHLAVTFVAERAAFLSDWTTDLDRFQVSATLSEVGAQIRTGANAGQITNERGRVIGTWLMEETL